VLVTKSGSIGRIAVVETDNAFSLFEASPRFPFLASWSRRTLAFALEEAIAGIAGRNLIKGAAVKHLHRRPPVDSDCSAPLIEQQRIVAKVEELTSILDRAQAQLTAARTSQEAFAAAAVAHLDEAA